MEIGISSLITILPFPPLWYRLLSEILRWIRRDGNAKSWRLDHEQIEDFSTPEKASYILSWGSRMTPCTTIEAEQSAITYRGYLFSSSNEKWYRRLKISKLETPTNQKRRGTEKSCPFQNVRDYPSVRAELMRTSSYLLSRISLDNRPGTIVDWYRWTWNSRSTIWALMMGFIDGDSRADPY